MAKKPHHTQAVIPDFDYLFSEEESPKKKKQSAFVGKLLKMNFWRLVLIYFLYIIKASNVWALPIITANIINIATGGMSQSAYLEIGINAAVLAVLYLQNVPMHMLYARLGDNMLRNISGGMKCTLVRKLQRLSITYHKNMQSGKVQAKFLRDLEMIDSLLGNIVRTVIPTVISLVISVGIALFKSGIVSLFFLAVIPVNVGFSMLFRRIIRKTNKDFRLANEDMSGKLTQILQMMTVTKSHGLEDIEESQFQLNVKKFMASGLKVDGTTAHFGAWLWVVNGLLSEFCLVFCAVLSLHGLIAVGDIVLYTSLFATISSYVSTLVGVVPQLGTGSESVNSITEIMTSKDVEGNLSKGKDLAVTGEITFENVSYRYPDCAEDTIKDFSMQIKAGECIAFVGSSGSGKTTVMNLIIGLLLPTEGRLLIDGEDITSLNLRDYRHNISVVPQNAILFSGSIRDNITYGLSMYSESELQEVIHKADIDEFLPDLPQGLDTDVGEGGNKLSGGQKQRVTIARALLRNPHILILDEATSALDNAAEYHVQKAIAQSIKGRTTFIVAHRLSTIRNADRVVVLENGQCVEMGTYDELMERKGRFFELKQLSDLNVKEASIE